MQLITPNALESVRRKIQTQKTVRSGWDIFDARMRSLVGRMGDLEVKNREWAEAAKGRVGFTHMNFLRLMAQEASRLAFHHSLTGDRQSLSSAARILDWTLALPEWRSQGVRNGWDSDLWTADIAASAAIALDCAGTHWDTGFVDRLRKAIATMGVEPVMREWIDPATRIHALDSMGHNWWSVCVAGATMAMFSVDDLVPNAEVRFNLVAGAIEEFFNYAGNVLQNKQRTFGADGDFIESIGYLDYTLHNLVMVFDLYRERLGIDLAEMLPVLREVCDYYMASVQPLRNGVQRLNFGDMGSGRDTIGSYNHNPAPVWLWLSSKFGRADLFHLVERTHPQPQDVYEFLLWPEVPPEGGFAGAPGDRIFRTTGIAVLRDGYADDSTVFAIKTGEKWNHNQSDAGSFILSSKGVELLIDPGTTEYSSPLHASYFKRGFSHNVVLHNGRDQVEDLDHVGTKFMGKIAANLFAPRYKYLLADATGPWEGVYRRCYRHVVWIDGAIVLIDDLMVWDAGDFTALFHHAGELELSGHGFVVRHQGETLRAHFVSPIPHKIDLAEGYLSKILPNDLKFEYEVSTRPYARVHYTSDSPRVKLVTLLELPGANLESVDAIEGADVSGVRIRRGGVSTEVVVNHRADGSVMHLNSTISHGPMRTDAFLFVVQRNEAGELLRLGIHNGSQMLDGDQVVYSSLLKSDVLLEPSHERLKVFSNLSSATRADFGSMGFAWLPPGPYEGIVEK
jgi:hypothetical protein